MHKKELLGGVFQQVAVIIPRRKLRNELLSFYHKADGDVFLAMKKLSKEKWFKKLSETQGKKVFEIHEFLLRAKFASETALYLLHPVIQNRIAEGDSRWEPLISSLRPWHKLTSKEWKKKVAEAMEIIHVYDPVLFG